MPIPKRCDYCNKPTKEVGVLYRHSFGAGGSLRLCKYCNKKMSWSGNIIEVKK